MKHAIPSFSFVILLSTTQVTAQPTQLPIDAAHSVISFSVGFAGDITNIEGRFNDFQGEVGYEHLDDPLSFFANVIINVSSINTGDAQRDEDLKGPNYFNVDDFPEISFRSSSVTKSENGYLLKGNFEMLGISKTLEMTFVFNHKAPVVWVLGEPRIAAKAGLTLNRNEFNIPKRGWDSMVASLGSMVLNDQVEIRLVIQGVGKGLSDLLLDKIESQGVQAGIDEYKRLVDEYKGMETYNFGAGTLAQLSFKLSRSGEIAKAITIAQFATEEESENYLGFYALGIAHKANGTKAEAIANFEIVLELNPEFDRARKQLEAMKSEG